MDRTLRLPLKPTPEQAQSLLETMRQFTHSFNLVCAQGWRLKQGNAYTLHKITYRNAKSLWPDLVSDLHVQARQKASEAVKAAIALSKKGRRVGQPQSALCPPRYNKNSFSLDRCRGTVNLATVAGRQKVRFSVPGYVADALSEGGTPATADLCYHKGQFTLHVVYRLPNVTFKGNEQALGVDLGVCRPAVTSDNRFHGQRRWRQIEHRRHHLRRRLQVKGTRSAKRRLRLLAGRTQRFRRDCDHVLSRRILYGIAPGTTVVVENLTNLRQRVRASRGEAKRRLHCWSFAQLRSFLEYKAEALGCRVIGVDPRHTSQRCHKCGYISRGNRPDQSRFICRSCGHQDNADRNAALNIRDRYLAGWASGPSRRLPSESLLSQRAVSCSLVSGPKNPTDGETVRALG